METLVAHVFAWATPGRLLLGAVIFALSVLVSIGISVIVVVRLPADYFVREHRPLPLAGRSLGLRIAARVLLNLLGIALIVAGLAMSVPGVPGQGLLTVLLGIMLTEIPGKHRLERALVRRTLIRGAIDRVRTRFNKPPIEIPEASPVR